MKLLCIPTGSMGAGGAETFMMKLFRVIDEQELHMDFCVAADHECLYDREILERGSKLFHITAKTIDVKQYKSDLSKLLRAEQYDIVLRLGDTCFSFYDLWIAKKCHVPVLAFRSCNSSFDGSKLQLFIHKALRGILSRFINMKIAPSTEAAEFTFGKRVVKQNEVHILHNGLILQNFQYSQQAAVDIRKEFHIEDKFVIGHIGRFFHQKNHAFLIDVFAEIVKVRKDAILMLVGSGELQKDIQLKVERDGLTDHVIFTGVRKDIGNILSAMDVFVFPSLFEGMPNAVIEAQANGLHCFVSDTITKEANISGLVTYLPLESGAKKWADKILASDIRRVDTTEAFIKNKYEINAVAEEFVSLLRGGINGKK